MTVAYQMHNISRGTIAATLESTSVYFDLDARVAIPITDEMKEAARAFIKP
jgi:acyl-CoA thioester hydrolase